MQNEIKIDLTKPQSEVFQDKSRFKVLITGRRFGKTYLLTIIAIAHALSNPNSRILMLQTTYSNARDYFFNLINSIIGATVKHSYSSLEFYFDNGSIIRCAGSDNYNSFRGAGYNLVIVDELKDHKSELWYRILRPALSDRLGGAVLSGTPEGKSNWVFDIYNDPEFKSFHYTTAEGGLVSETEIEAAKRQMDDISFRQEYYATFEDLQNQVYYAFTDNNIKSIDVEPHLDTYISFDFNVDPMTAHVIQVYNENDNRIVKEFVLRNSNTNETGNVVKEYLLSKNINKVYLTGDYAGVQRATQSSVSDWVILRDIFKDMTNRRPYIRPTLSIKDRVQATNSLLKNSNGDIRLTIDENCKHTIKDFRSVEWKGNTFTLDSTNKDRTHQTDSVSYFCYNIYPIR